MIPIAALILVGCGRTSPVEEISVTASGVAIDEQVSAPADSWPQWRGPRIDGVAPDQPLPTKWSETKNVRWQADVPGRGHSSPIVVGDFVFLATALDEEEKQLVLAYDRKTGAERWQAVVHEGHFPSRGEIHRKGSNANGTLACDGARIFAAFFNSGKVIVTALDLVGKQLWQQPIGEFDSKFGYAPSPILYKSLVIVAADNWGGGYISALDTRTGKIAWRIARPVISSYSSPTVANVGGKDQLLISGCNMLASYDPATGATNWTTTCTAEGTCGTPVTTPEMIFASGGHPERQTVGLDANGKIVWTNNTKIYEPSLIVVGDNVYAVGDDGIAYCWDTKTGRAHWRKRLSGSFSASPISCNGNIYVSDLYGKTYVFRASSEAYEEVSVNRLGSDCYASPAIADGEIFYRVGTEGHRDRQEKLICIATGPQNPH
jgi:outer membrane protein assembly factor BamB